MNMKIELTSEVADVIQGLTTVLLLEEDYQYLSDRLLRVGLGTVKAALAKHPGLC